jgi:hypothetical protein
MVHMVSELYWWAWLTSYDILDDPGFPLLIIQCNSIEAVRDLVEEVVQP